MNAVSRNTDSSEEKTATGASRACRGPSGERRPGRPLLIVARRYHEVNRLARAARRALTAGPGIPTSRGSCGAGTPWGPSTPPRRAIAACNALTSRLAACGISLARASVSPLHRRSHCSVSGRLATRPAAQLPLPASPATAATIARVPAEVEAIGLPRGASLPGRGLPPVGEARGSAPYRPAPPSRRPDGGRRGRTVSHPRWHSGG
jgi:hypothetical protein